MERKKKKKKRKKKKKKKKQDRIDIKPVSLQDLMIEAKMVKQEIKEDNSTDINEQNIAEIINLKELSKPMTELPLLEKDNDNTKQKILSLIDKVIFKKWHTDLRDFPHLLQFFYRFPNLPWIIQWEYKIEKHPQYPSPMLTRKFKLKWWNKFNFDHICQELQKKTSSSQIESSNFFLEKSQVQCQLAFISNKKHLKKQLLEAASQISNEDDTVMESTSPNDRTHPEAFQDSQDPYDM